MTIKKALPNLSASGLLCLALAGGSAMAGSLENAYYMAPTGQAAAGDALGDRHGGAPRGLEAAYFMPPSSPARAAAKQLVDASSTGDGLQGVYYLN